MLEPPCLRQCPGQPQPSLINVSQVRQGHREVTLHRGVGVVRQARTGDTMRTITYALLQKFMRSKEFAKEATGQPHCATTTQFHDSIISRLTDSFDLLG